MHETCAGESELMTDLQLGPTYIGHAYWVMKMPEDILFRPRYQ